MKRRIITAGMPRSGSTWLYNATRLLYRENGVQNVGAGWIGDLENFNHNNILIIKAHNFDKSFVDEKTTILYSYRDIRDVLASMKRIWDTDPDLKTANYLIRNDDNWREVASFVMRYEDMLKSKRTIIEGIAKCLELDSCDSNVVIDAISKLDYHSSGERNTVYHLNNLFHHRHITDGRHGSWEDQIPIEMVSELNRIFEKWLLANNYL